MTQSYEKLRFGTCCSIGISDIDGGFASHHKIGVVVDKSKTSIYPYRVTPHLKVGEKSSQTVHVKYLFNGFKYSDLKPLLISTQNNNMAARAMVFKLLRNCCNKTLVR